MKNDLFHKYHYESKTEYIIQLIITKVCNLITKRKTNQN
jgi:hypothetical protein